MQRKEAEIKFSSERLSSINYGGGSVGLSSSDDSAIEIDTSRGEDKGDVGEVEIADVNLVTVDADIEIELQRVNTCPNHQMIAYTYTRNVKLEGGIARRKLGELVVEESATDRLVSHVSPWAWHTYTLSEPL